MAQPSLADVHIDAALTDFSVAFFQDADKFVARQFSPVVPVGKQSDKYFIYDKAETLRTDAVKRAPGTEAAVRNYKLSTGNFFCDVYSIASDVSEQIRANSDPALDPEEDAAKLTMGDIMMRMEVDFAAAAFATSIWDTNVVGTTNFVKWNDPSSVPITDISTGIETIGDNTGFDPNVLLLGSNVWAKLRHHPDIIARLPDSSPRIATKDFLANLLDIEKVLVAKAVRNSAEEGATASIGRILGENALLAFVDPNPGLRSATAMRTFVWSGLLGSTDGIRTKRMDIAHKDAFPRVETDAAFDFKVTASELGYFFSDAVD